MKEGCVAQQEMRNVVEALPLLLAAASGTSCCGRRALSGLEYPHSLNTGAQQQNMLKECTKLSGCCRGVEMAVGDRYSQWSKLKRLQRWTKCITSQLCVLQTSIEVHHIEHFDESGSMWFIYGSAPKPCDKVELS